MCIILILQSVFYWVSRIPCMHGRALLDNGSKDFWLHESAFRAQNSKVVSSAD
jgi:hypothetical protein